MDKPDDEPACFSWLSTTTWTRAVSCRARPPVGRWPAGPPVTRVPTAASAPADSDSLSATVPVRACHIEQTRRDIMMLGHHDASPCSALLAAAHWHLGTRGSVRPPRTQTAPGPGRAAQGGCTHDAKLEGARAGFRADNLSLEPRRAGLRLGTAAAVPRPQAEPPGPGRRHRRGQPEWPGRRRGRRDRDCQCQPQAASGASAPPLRPGSLTQKTDSQIKSFEFFAFTT